MVRVSISRTDNLIKPELSYQEARAKRRDEKMKRDQRQLSFRFD